MEFGESFDLPISPRIVQQMAIRTIRAITDAIVELVTNSDDSYNRLNKSMDRAGRIEIYIERVKGGKCKKLVVKDFAEGMSREQLQKAIIFGEEASRFETGRSVRGLFGRGLKEAIIALGQGEIATIHDGIADGAKIWSDENRRPKGSLFETPLPVTEEIRREIGIEKGNGTKVTITVTNEEISCPDYKTLKSQTMNHYALRDINASKQREVELTVQDWKMKASSPISYSPPEGKIVCDKTVKLPGFGDDVSIKVWESGNELESPRNNPFAKAGLSIKTEGAILDDQLFGYENERAACYFFGEVFCKSLATRLRTDESLINPNRGGLEWRRHPYCQALQTEIEKALAPRIEKKKGELEAKPAIEVSTRTKKMLYDMCRLLNRLAQRELAELPPTNGEGGLEPGEKITDLTIKPEMARIEVDIPRSFLVYAPQGILSQSITKNTVQIESDNPYIQVLETALTLVPHPKYSHIRYGRLRVVGRVWGEEGWITCRLGSHEAIALVTVAPLGKGKKKKKLAGPRGGFFTDIEPDESENPLQRVRYEAGKIKIHVRFPVVAKYLGPGLKGSDTPQGGAILAELVGEAFCREMAQKGIDAGKYLVMPGAEIAGFNTAVNELQRKYLHLIHSIVRR